MEHLRNFITSIQGDNIKELILLVSDKYVTVYDKDKADGRFIYKINLPNNSINESDVINEFKKSVGKVTVIYEP